MTLIVLNLMSIHPLDIILKGYKAAEFLIFYVSNITKFVNNFFLGHIL